MIRGDRTVCVLGGEAKTLSSSRRGRGLLPSTFYLSIVDRYVTVSEKDSFLTTRKLARLEGILAGGSADGAARRARGRRGDPGPRGAGPAVILPDGGRSTRPRSTPTRG